MKSISLLIPILLFVGCGTVSTVYEAEKQTILLPGIGETLTSNIGDSLVSKITAKSYPAIDVSTTHNYGDRILTFEINIKPGKYIAKRNDETYLYYYGDESIFSGYDTLGNSYPGGIAISSKENEVVGFVDVLGSIYRQKIPTSINYKATKHIDLLKPYSKKEFIYNGYDNSSIQFTYREVNFGEVEEELTQTAKYNLNNDKVIGFKELRIKILSADNREITYKVINNFSE